MRRFWPVLLVLTATLALGVTWLIVNHLTREEPNYSRIDEGLYLGGLVADPPPGTHAVLNLCETADPYRLEVNNWVPIPDAEPVPSLAWLREQVEFIEAQRRAGRQVFIHCRNGVSRSGMVVVAYEMWKSRWTREEALAFVRARRPGVRPNPAFMSLLAEWEQALKSRTD